MTEGRIIKGIAGFYYVHDGENVYECKAKGIFRNKKEKPMVGDFVRFEPVDEVQKTGNITDILPRASQLIRPEAANVDQMLVVFSASVPSPNYEMINRYLVSIHDLELPVHLLITKIDLAEKPALKEIEDQFLNVPVALHFVSSKTGEGMEELKDVLKGKVSCLSGPSGVGKSSLLNGLLGESRMEVGELSRKIERGKNTTRHTELFYVGENTYVMDTPGFTSVDFDSVNPVNLPLMFDEFIPYLVHCRFSDCTHRKEKDCAVCAALSDGKISRTRYDSYVNMYDYLINLRRY